MSGKKGVSGKTHSKVQLDDYANQHNPNNKAYIADKKNQMCMKSNRKKSKNQKYDIGILAGESYGWCDD